MTKTIEYHKEQINKLRRESDALKKQLTELYDSALLGRTTFEAIESQEAVLENEGMALSKQIKEHTNQLHELQNEKGAVIK